ncbi:MAG TPA: hemerythrin domain-containing protein [Polyangia bacterium]|jgi:hemerythrin-like domain-containing protein
MGTNPPNLLNDDGSASMATAFLTSHHGFRRDIRQFAGALGKMLGGNTSNAAALGAEWKHYRETLHGHHTMEDTALFPSLKQQHPELAPIIDGLVADHQKMDPMLEDGDRAFADLAENVRPAVRVVGSLGGLLHSHLETEETHVVPFIREAKAFPPPANEAELEMYAQGFAWSSYGIAQDILDKLYALLAPELVAKMPAARAAFAERCKKVWGSAHGGSSRTPVPDWL